MVQLDIISTPPGAQVYIDNINTFQITPASFDIAAGQHSYLIRQTNYTDVAGVVDLTLGSYVVNAVMQSTDFEIQQKFNDAIIKLGYVGLAVSVISLLWSRSSKSQT